MANFDEALAITLSFEGGLSEDPKDPGGITNMGISLRFLEKTGLKYDFNHDGKIDASEIKGLTHEQAATIYRDEFWLPNHYGDIENQGIANYLFDIAVNMGSGEASRIVREVDVFFGGINLPPIALEGCYMLTRKNLVERRGGAYRLIAATRHEEEYLDGWLSRANSPKFWEKT